MRRPFLSVLLVFLTTALLANQGYLGISVKSDDVNSQKGLRVVNVYDDGSAWVAGLQENDLITHFNGKTVDNSSDLTGRLANFQWGDMVRIQYLRDGFSNTVDIVLGYEARTKTYEIVKSEQITGEVIWYFDDNTTIILADGVAQSITKKLNDGDKVTLDLSDMNDLNDLSNLPQHFRDLDDKLDVISRTIEEQAGRNVDVDQITFIKDAAREVSSDAIGIEEMRISEFKVFPNPSNGQFEVKLMSDERGALSWNIFDVRGASVDSGFFGEFNGSFTQQFNLPSKFTGTYLLYMRIGDKRISKQIVLK